MNKQTMEITTVRCGRSVFGFWYDEKTIVVIQPMKSKKIKAFSFAIDDTFCISVKSQLPKAQRSEIIRHLARVRRPGIYA